MLNTTEVLTLAKAERLGDIISLCEKSLREEAAKAKGGSSEVKRYKTALKIMNDSNNEKCKISYVEDGKQYFTDGYIAFELNNPINNLPVGENHFDIKSYINVSMADYEQAEPFNIPELKVGLKIAKATRAASSDKKAKKQGLSNFDGGIYIHKNENRKWGCVVENILKVIEILGDNCDVYLPTKSTFNAGIVENANGRAIIMPKI